MDRLNILAVDTTTSRLKLALSASGSETVFEFEENFKHVENLLPSVEKCLAKSGTDKSALTHIAVCTGPGSFTGIRIGIASALGLAYAAGIKCFGFSSFDVYNFLFAGAAGIVIVPVIDAKKDRYYCAFLTGQGDYVYHDIPAQEIEEMIMKEHADKKVVFTGEDFKSLKNKLGISFKYTSEYNEGYTAGDMLKAAVNAVNSGSELKYPHPVYIRKSEAETEYLKKMKV